jgi:tRNA modification GTPase
MGKSTLLNALLNEDRAIVSDIAGTTRDTVEDSISLAGIRFKFIDTAGIRSTEDTIEQMGIARSFAKAREASVILLLFDASETTPEELMSMVSDVRLQAGDDKRLFLLANKIDKQLLSEAEIVKRFAAVGEVVPVSAKNKTHLEELKKALADTVSSGQVDSGETIVTNARHYDALTKAAVSLAEIQQGLQAGVTGDFLAIDIRKTLYHLGEITGQISADDLLHSIFSRFCIGK